MLKLYYAISFKMLTCLLYLPNHLPLDFSSDCSTSPIGVSNPDIIPDSHMTASSTRTDTHYQPWFGRLRGNRGVGWCSLTSDSNNDWLQIYFGDMFTVCRVDTQGDINGNEWVTAFKLSFSTDGNIWTTYKFNNGADVVRHVHSCEVKVGHSNSLLFQSVVHWPVHQYAPPTTVGMFRGSLWLKSKQ